MFQSSLAYRCTSVAGEGGGGGAIGNCPIFFSSEFCRYRKADQHVICTDKVSEVSTIILKEIAVLDCENAKKFLSSLAHRGTEVPTNY